MTNRATLAILVCLTVLVLLLRVMLSTAASSGSRSGAAPAPAAAVAGQSAAVPSGEGGAGATPVPASPSAEAAPHARFRSPSPGGMALDRCRSAATACGQPAADAYCQTKGYSRASRFRTHEFYPTRAIGDGFVCTRSFGRCDRFTEIWCAR